MKNKERAIRSRSGVIAIAAVLCAALALAPAATADLVIGSKGSGAGQYDGAGKLAADSSNGTLYVADRNNKRVDVFDSAGNFIRAFGWDVIPAGQPGDTGTKLEACTTATTCKAGIAGSGAGQFGTLDDIAVDDDPLSPAFHDVYVIDEQNHRVLRFDPEGSFVLTFGKGVNTGTSGNADVCTSAGPPTNVCGAGSKGVGVAQFQEALQIEVGPAGTVYAGDTRATGYEMGDLTQSRIQKFEPSGSFIEQFTVDTEDRGRLTGLAVDSAGVVYISNTAGTGAVRHLDSSGNEIVKFHPSSNIQELALDASDNLFLGDVANFSGAGAIYEYDSVAASLSTFYGSLGMLLPIGLAPFHSGAGDVFISELRDEDQRLLYISLPPPGPVVLPKSTTAPQAEVRSTKAMLEAAINPEGKGTTYHFEYVNDATYQADGPGHGFDHAESSEELSPVPDPGSPGEPLFKAHLARTKVEGLAPETTYHFRVVAEDSEGQVTVGPDGTPFTTLEPLQIRAIWATDVGTDTGRLHAEVNPLGGAATGYFEYVEEAIYQADVEAVGPGHGFDHAIKAPDVDDGDLLDFGSGETPKVATAMLHPLSPATVYRYRVIVQDHCKPDPEVVCTFSGGERSFSTFPSPSAPRNACPNQAFRTGFSAALPDCRAYELVSPLDKNNSDVGAPERAAEIIDQGSSTGDAFTFTTFASAFAEPEGAPFAHQYLSERDAETGWSTHSLAARRSTIRLYRSESFTNLFKYFSEDLCSAWMLQDTDVVLAPGAPPGFPNLYRRDNCGENEGSYKPLAPLAPPGFDPAAEPENSRYFPMVQGFSADGGLSVFRADAPLTPDALQKARMYQTYASKDGELHLVSVLPNGNPAKANSSVGTVQGPATLEFIWDSLHRAVSADGSRVFWTASADATPVAEAAGGQRGGPGTLYMRANPTQPQSSLAGKECTEAEMACTYPVSGLVSAEPARFHMANSAGTRAIFSIEDGPLAGNLYEFSAEEEEGAIGTKATLIAEGLNGAGGLRGGVVGASEDASRVYFASTKALSEEANSEGDKAQAGKANLYLYESGEGLTFIATLARLDNAFMGVADPPSPIGLYPYKRSSRVSPDGLHAVFTAATPLTGYDNADAKSGEPDTEVYLYDASADGGSGDLLCVSCSPSGARPSGRQIAVLESGQTPIWASARIPVWQTALHPSRALSADGDLLFFESFEGLVPRDTNGRQDVYEWERAASAKECEGEIGGELFVPSSAGCLSLISSGAGPDDAEFLDASADGRDVFFVTGSSLLPQDPGLLDVYDAREGGGFPSPTGPGPGCEGQACQSPPPGPDDPTPASATFKGPGNVKAGKPACRRGRVRRKGRCVTRKQRSKRAAKPRTARDRRASR
jgi:hypothetical protein